MKQLAGIILCYNAIRHDYCYLEAIASLLSACDHVFIVDPGSTDGTTDTLLSLNGPITVIQTNNWNEFHGKEKLAALQNIGSQAAEDAGYEWQFILQADEVLSNSNELRSAILNHPSEEGFLIPRINLWGDSRHYLSCPNDRQPCSTNVIRLAKPWCRSYGDGENIDAQCKRTMDNTDIFHLGFIRNKYVMLDKVKFMQEEVFGIDHDPRLDKMTDGFDPWSSHTKQDVSVLDKPLPVFVREWAEERDAMNAKKPATL